PAALTLAVAGGRPSHPWAMKPDPQLGTRPAMRPALAVKQLLWLSVTASACISNRAPNLVEHLFNRIKQCWRVAMCYGKFAVNYLGFIQLASIELFSKYSAHYKHTLSQSIPIRTLTRSIPTH